MSSRKRLPARRARRARPARDGGSRSAGEGLCAVLELPSRRRDPDEERLRVHRDERGERDVRRDDLRGAERDRADGRRRGARSDRLRGRDGGTARWVPVGICRQVLREFARDMPIALVAEQGGQLTRRDTTLAELLPDAFDGSALKKPKKKG